MSLPTDIEKRIRSDAKDQADELVRRVDAFAAKHPDFGERVLRCVVFVAQGKLDQLESAMQLAELDWRDVIVAAEYVPKPGTKRSLGDYVQVRDMNRPFD